MDEPARANLIFVDVAPGNHEPEVSLRLPQGLFFLCSFIGNQFVEIHGEETLQMIRQVVLAKIKEKDRGPGHEPRHPDLQPIEEMHQRIGHLKEKIDHLRQEGQNEEAEGLQREVEEIKRKIEETERGSGHEQPRHDPQPIEEMHQRIGHLKEKIDHLRQEGRNEEAEGLQREVEEIKRKIEEIERGPGHEQSRHDPQPIEEMHRRIGNLKEKIDQLRREGRHEEAEGLKREVDDIRRKIEEIEHGPGLGQSHWEPPRNSEQRARIINEAVDNMLKAAQRLHQANMHDQAEMSGLDVDIRTDVFSLGVLLYELLTGTTPFDSEYLLSKGYGEMHRIIREEEPIRPSTKISTLGETLMDVAKHRRTSPELLCK